MAPAQVSEMDEKRASLYWWFATIFTKELELAQIEAYRTGDGADLLKSLSEEPELSAAVAKINNGLAKCLAMAHPEVELAADFCQMFLGDTKVGAPPYASVYLSSEQLMYQEPHDAMAKILTDAGMQIDPEFKEPADHIAIQLDYLGNLIMREGDTSSEQRQFIEQQLMSWLPLWLEASEKKSCNDFYLGFIELLSAYLKLDLAELDS